MDYKEIINRLKETQDLKVKYKGCGEPEKSAIEAINELLSGIKAAEARAEKAEKERDAAVDCIDQIQSARDHRRPAYVVDQILRQWSGIKEE